MHRTNGYEKNGSDGADRFEWEDEWSDSDAAPRTPPKPRRRKKERRKHHPFLLLALVVAAILFVQRGPSDLLRAFSSRGSASGAYTDDGASAPQDTMEALAVMARQEPRVKAITANPGAYPAPLLKALGHNAELLDFTLDYPEKKGTSAKRINLSAKRSGGGVPLLMQWDEDWGYAPYGSGIIGLDGCGPTCLSMVAVGLTGDDSLNPKAVASFAEKNGYLDEAAGGTLWTLMSEGAAKLGLSSRELSLDETVMKRELSKGHAIICSMRPGDFTTVGHFIVLSGYQNGSFTVRDPNSRKRSEKKWTYDVLKPQIRNLWAFARA